VESVHRALSPKHGSWLNQAEIAISLLSRQCLGQRPDWGSSFSAEADSSLESSRDRDRVTIQWSFTRRQARKKFGYKITRSRYWCFAYSFPAESKNWRRSLSLG